MDIERGDLQYGYGIMDVETQTPKKKLEMELNEQVLGSMAVGAVFKDYNAKVNSLDFHRSDDLLVTASDDESIRLYDTANALLVKTIHSKKYGVDQICFTHHPSSVVYSSKNGWDESLRYLSLYDNRYLRYFKGHRDRVVSLCMSPKNDSFMSGSLDHTVRLWDLRTNVCQGLLRVRGRPSVAYDQQGLVFAVAMEGGAVKLFDVRSFDKGPFDTFLVGGDTAEVSGMKFSNDGKLMLLSTTSNRIYVLDAYSGNQLHCFRRDPNPDGHALEASFSPDGQFVLSGSGDGNLYAWSTATGTQISCWGNNNGVPAVVKWAPRRFMFASASQILSFWIPDLSKRYHFCGQEAASFWEGSGYFRINCTQWGDVRSFLTCDEFNTYRDQRTLLARVPLSEDQFRVLMLFSHMYRQPR